MYIQNFICSDLYEMEGTVYFSLFDKKIKLLVVKGSNIGYAANCVDYLNALNAQLVDKLCEASIRYCDESLHLVGVDKISFEAPRSILNSFHPQSLIVPVPMRGLGPVLRIELKCDWNNENGMVWIVRNDKVAYVGAFEDLNTWGDFEDMAGNYARAKD